MLDRAILIIRSQPLFQEWRKKTIAAGNLSVPSTNVDSTAWIVMHPDYFEEPGEFAEYLEELKPLIFCEILLACTPSEQLWPKDRSAAAFDRWFQVEVITKVRSVEELLAEDISGEKIDQADAFLRTTVEYQVRHNEPPVVRATLGRLENLGFPREEALKLIMLALACELGAANEADKITDLNQEKYKKYLEQLPNTSFVQEWAERE